MEEKIEEYLVAPSKISDSDVQPIAQYMFGRPFASHNEVKEFAGESAEVPQSHIASKVEPDDITQVVEQLARSYAGIHNLTVEEPAGYQFLGELVVFFSEMLCKQSKLEYKYHPKRAVAKNSNPGQIPSTDVAIVLKSLLGGGFISKVLYEYKTAIHPLLAFTEAKVLMELFLQCYYVLKFEKQTEILGCLTDLHTWHYFQFKLTSKLEISWYLKFQMTLPPQAEEVSEHVLILLKHFNITQPQNG